MSKAMGRLFDDGSKHVDRYGLLLGVTTPAVVTLYLIALGSPSSRVTGEISLVLLTLFVGASVLLALRAFGVVRRYRPAVITFGALIVGLFVGQRTGEASDRVQS